MPNPLTRPLALPWDGALRKAATLIMGRQRGGMTGGLTWSTGAPWGVWRTSKGFDYQAAVGDVLTNSIVQACMNAISWCAPEPPPRVYRLDDQDEEDVVRRHPLGLLLHRPNPALTWGLLMSYIVHAMHLTGNAYLWKSRSAGGRVVELWPLHPGCVEPAWPEDAGTKQWLTHYDYKPSPDLRDPIRLEPQDVVHLRLNLDLNNMRKGRSPLLSAFKHIFTDEEAAAFTGAMLRNFGVPGVILSPNPAAMANGGAPSQEDVQRVKEQYRQSWGGENRGEPMVTGGPFDVNVVSFSPQQMNLDKLQLMPEARISAVLGVPAIVANLLVGMDRATFNNTSGLREHFVEAKMVPYWRLLEEELTHSLVPDFGDPQTLRVRFDLSDVRSLQEDMDKKYDRVTKFMLAGGMLINEARQELGMVPLPEGDILYVPSNVTATDPAELLAEPEPVALPLPAGQRPVALLEDRQPPTSAEEEEDAAG